MPELATPTTPPVECTPRAIHLLDQHGKRAVVDQDNAIAMAHSFGFDGLRTGFLVHANDETLPPDASLRNLLPTWLAAADDRLTLGNPNAELADILFNTASLEAHSRAMRRYIVAIYAGMAVMLSGLIVDNTTPESGHGAIGLVGLVLGIGATAVSRRANDRVHHAALQVLMDNRAKALDMPPILTLEAIPPSDEPNQTPL